jgi:superfamily II DNA or RNA helicase
VRGWALKRSWTAFDQEALTFGESDYRCECYIETDEGLLVPRAYESFSNPDESIVLGGDLSELDPISLRAEQVPAVNAMLKSLHTPGTGAILFAPCGKGKTVMGLEILRRLKRKALVLVHKSFLVDQWVERAKTFLPKAKVGLWQRDQIPTGDEDIVIGMVQSIVNPRREYPEDIYEMFGTLVADETHRYAAPMWQEAINNFGAAYRIGLTATPERKDGLHHVFYSHIGPIAYYMEGHKRLPLIWRIDTETVFPQQSYLLYNGDVNTSRLVTMISQVEPRTDRIVDFAMRALSKGRKVLILSERVAHTKEMNELLNSKLSDDMTSALYIGGMKQSAREKASEADVICGTYAMAQEGLDIPALDTLILATPKTSITQSVGRILRDSPDKKDPVVVDFVDSAIPILMAYWGARKKTYTKLGYNFF